jgi:hypothetical protein
MHQRRARLVVIATALVCAQPLLIGQWLRYPTTNVPRMRDGSVNLNAPAPRTRDGRPDFSGIWLTGNPIPCNKEAGADFLECGAEISMAREAINIGVSLPGGLPYQPWAADLVKQRTRDQAKDDPHAQCLPDTFARSYGLPHMQKLIQAPGLLVMLDEMNAGYRQIFTDGRPLPPDPQPAWNGYSSARWTGDTLIIQTIGFRDNLWLDVAGSPLTDAAKMTERLRRPDYGHLEIELTVDDPKAYTKPWTVKMKQQIVVDTDLVDEICLENEKSFRHMSKQ